MANTQRSAISCTVLSLLLDVYVYRTHRSEFIGKLSLASGLIGITVMPYTMAFLSDTNAQLLALSANNAASVEAEPEDKKAALGARVDDLVQTWENRHLVRYVAFVGAWGLAMSALVLDGRVLGNRV